MFVIGTGSKGACLDVVSVLCENMLFSNGISKGTEIYKRRAEFCDFVPFEMRVFKGNV